MASTWIRNFVLVAVSSLALSASAQQNGLPVRDDDFACIEKSVADHYVQDFKIDVTSFGGLELCRSSIDTKKLFNDLLLIEQGHFAGNVRNNLVRGFLPADQYYNWMKEQTYGISRGQDVPYATAYNSGGYFTMQDGWAQLSTLGRVGTVIHEARHTEGYMHIVCTQGPYAGSRVSGCDRDYAYGGSHAIEMEYYARVSVAGTNFHPVYQKMARLMAMGRSNFVFNQTPLKMRETILTLSASGRAYLLDNGRWVERETPPVAGHLKRTSFGGAVFAGTAAYALDPYQNSGFDWSVFDDFSYFKLLRGDHGLTETIADFEELDVNGRRYAVVLTDKHNLSGFVFPQGAWGRPTTAPRDAARFVTTTPSGKSGLFLVSDQGRIDQVDPATPSRVTALKEAWPNDLRAVATTADGLYRLDQSGALTLVRSGQEQTIETVEPTEQIVTIPLYDSFEVRP